MAYTDIQDLDPQVFAGVEARNWSNAWQSGLVTFCEHLVKSLPELDLIANKLAKAFGIDAPVNTLDKLQTFYLWAFS